MATPRTGNPHGAPSKYKPEYCKLAIDMGKKGKQPVQIAAQIGVSKQSLYEWASVHPEFGEALAQSRSACEAWIVAALDKKVVGQNPRGDVGAMKFLLSACHGYREKTDSVVTAQIDTKISVREWGDEPSNPT